MHHGIQNNQTWTMLARQLLPYRQVRAICAAWHTQHSHIHHRQASKQEIPGRIFHNNRITVPVSLCGCAALDACVPNPCM